MPRDSIGRRVARAAAIGGSRSYRSRTPYGWYTIVLVVCVIGFGLIVFSRHERQNAASATTTTTTLANTTPPLLTDHWQVALSLDVCGKVGVLPKSADQQSGIITTGNGAVDIEPARAGTKASQFEGANATLGKFLTAQGAGLTNTSLTLPGSLGKLGGTHVNGSKCGSKPGKVQLFIWSSPTAATPFAPITTGAAATPYANGEMFALAFVPNGTSVPRPQAQRLVAAFLKSQTPTTTTSTSTTTTTKPGSTTTTRPGSTTTTKPVSTTTQPGSTTTTKPVSTTTSAG